MYGIAGLLTGRTLAGRYRIDAVVGRGGMGAVYRATDERLGREVAVKVIGTGGADPGDHARLRARFHREARAVASLRHPNVVAVYDFGTDAEVDLDFLVMELLRGEDLAARLTRTGAPPLGVAVSILRQAARGLAAGHRVGLVHRDIKPGNLFLEDGDSPDEPHVRVLDFGIAKLDADDGSMTALTEFGRAPFSPAYASPEQMSGEGDVGPASDVFSLAAVGYHLATGMRPFTSSDPARAAEEVTAAVRALPQRAPQLPGDLHEALVRALSLSPRERFRDAAAFAQALGVAPTVASAPRPATPVSAPSEPTLMFVADEEDFTRLQNEAPRPASTTAPAPRVPPPVPVRPAPLRATAVSVEPPAPPPVRPAPAHPVRPTAPVAGPAAPGAPMLEDRRQPGMMRRFLRALWEFSVTSIVLGLFVGSWALAASGVVEENRAQFLGGAVATVLFTPWAVHRLTGRRGRAGLGVLGSAAATGATVRYIGLDADPAILLAATFGLQVVTCFALSWLTRRSVREAVAV
ncbi:MAG TPA: serine/threonine-protein kinase [Longimicrobium sp.]|jgi:serine/threonine-protein kinase